MLKASLGRSVQQRPTNPDSADGKLSVLLPCYYVFSTTKMNVDVLQPTLIQSFNSFRVQNDTLFKIAGRGGTPHMKGMGMLVANFELNP